jgi:hypothetical protein
MGITMWYARLLGFAVLFVALCSWNCQKAPGVTGFLGHSGAALSSSGKITSPARPATASAGDDLQGPRNGTVLDAKSLRPVEHATIFHAGEVVYSGADGCFVLASSRLGEPILIKAPGYRQCSLAADNKEIRVRMEPLDVRGLYLTHFGVSSKLLRDRVMKLLRDTELNAVVIDVKGDRGLLSYKYDIPLARRIGAHKLPTIKDISSFIADLHRQNIYVIGRIVVFKDNLLADAEPRLAIINKNSGQPWIDNEHLAWVDPFQKEVWDYNIAIAIEAAKAGFDEIQFDYVRFPTDGRISAARYSQPNTMENRVKAIDTFLETTQKALQPYNVYFSADVFGYTPWNYNDTDIGQKIEEISQRTDYVSLMVYPSGYHLGIPGYLKPVAHPREVVYYTLEKAKKRLGGQAKKLRPWLQNFRDYAFDRRSYTGTEISLQIRACKEAGTSGYLLWDPANKYTYTLEAMMALKTSDIQMAPRKTSSPVASR